MVTLRGGLVSGTPLAQAFGSSVLDREDVHLTCTCLGVLLGRRGVSLSCISLRLTLQGREGAYLLPVT